MLLIFAVVVAIACTGSAITAQAPGLPPAPAQATSAVLTLDDALAKALARSPLGDAARQRLAAAAIARDVVARAPNPLIEVRTENLGTISPAQLPRDTFATISQPIELGGKLGARRADATALHAVADAGVASTAWTLALDVSERYVDAVRARGVLASLEEQRDGLAELVRVLTERTREGTSAEADLRKFEAEQTRITSQILRASIALERELSRLAAAIGESVPAVRLAMPQVPADLRDPATITLAQIDDRADVKATAARVARAETLAALERARGVPDVTVTAGYKRTSGVDTGLVAVSMPLPIFDRNRVAAAQAMGEARAARFDLEFLRQQALADARTQWTAARQLTDHAARLDSTLVVPAAVVRTAARSAFAEGRGDVLQLVDAERVYGEAIREALELRLDAALATIHARLALGEAPIP